MANPAFISLGRHQPHAFTAAAPGASRTKAPSIAERGAEHGDALSFWVGHHFKDRVRHFWPLSRHPKMVERGEAFFHRFGAWSVFLGRFFGPLRAIVPLIAGTFGMKNWLFQTANIASALLWAFVLLAPGAAAVKTLGW